MDSPSTDHATTSAISNQPALLATFDNRDEIVEALAEPETVEYTDH